MGRGAVRSGAPSAGTQAAAGTDGSQLLPRIILFDPPVRPCIVQNGTGNGLDILVKMNTELNGTVSDDFDNDSDDTGPGYLAVADGESVDASIGGALSIHSISFVTTDAGDDLDSVAVVGWAP